VSVPTKETQNIVVLDTAALDGTCKHFQLSGLHEQVSLISLDNHAKAHTCILVSHTLYVQS